MIIVAYVDPGLGLLAWQAVVAAFLGLLFHLKKTRTWLVGLITRFFRAGKRPASVPLELPPACNDAEQ